MTNNKMTHEDTKQMEEALKTGNGPLIARFALAVISGVVPVIGGAIGGISGIWSEKEQEKVNQLFATWLKLQQDELTEIGRTIFEIMNILDKNDDKVKGRIESPEYLRLMKKCFRNWSAAESEEKRKLIRNLLSNAAMTNLCSDDVISMFIDWIEKYSEAHFRVIKAVYNESGITRAAIWNKIYDSNVREDSAEADLFKLIIQDLSMGHVIRQHRDVDVSGNFIKPSQKTRRSSSRYYQSAFSDENEYELTELGKQFVHYTLNEIVPKLTE